MKGVNQFVWKGKIYKKKQKIEPLQNTLRIKKNIDSFDKFF